MWPDKGETIRELSAANSEDPHIRNQVGLHGEAPLEERCRETRTAVYQVLHRFRESQANVLA